MTPEQNKVLSQLWKHASFSHDPRAYRVHVFTNEYEPVAELVALGFLRNMTPDEDNPRVVRFTPSGAAEAEERRD